MHVAAWPAVTDREHGVDDVPPGCKKVSETLTLVDDEHDSYRATTSRHAGRDRSELDIAVLRTAAPLQVMPWKIGHSGATARAERRRGSRGFPLGAFRATNVGKVISPHDHDDYGDWDHDDFVSMPVVLG